MEDAKRIACPHNDDTLVVVKDETCELGGNKEMCPAAAFPWIECAYNKNVEKIGGQDG